MLGDCVFETVHENRLLLNRQVECRKSIGEVEHHFQELKIDAPFLLLLQCERMVWSAALHHRDRLGGHGQHQRGELMKDLGIRALERCHQIFLNKTSL